MEVSGIVPALRHGTLRDRDGLLLGRVEDLLFDAQTNRPAWLVVRLSGPDERRTLVPAPGARAGGGRPPPPHPRRRDRGLSRAPHRSGAAARARRRRGPPLRPA